MKSKSSPKIDPKRSDKFVWKQEDVSISKPKDQQQKPQPKKK